MSQRLMVVCIGSVASGGYTVPPNSPQTLGRACSLAPEDVAMLTRISNTMRTTGLVQVMSAEPVFDGTGMGMKKMPLSFNDEDMARHLACDQTVSEVPWQDTIVRRIADRFSHQLSRLIDIKLHSSKKHSVVRVGGIIGSNRQSFDVEIHARRLGDALSRAVEIARPMERGYVDGFVLETCGFQLPSPAPRASRFDYRAAAVAAYAVFGYGYGFDPHATEVPPLDGPEELARFQRALRLLVSR